uniref:U-box domain-containing protein n=1 Tax=Guillardia theta TaxID=55529 RepID=A0A7S4L1D5_GUITH|mmetsp:Transcript_35296/g.110303  ORF Transcript_35296/g.110303 Transcript_35296/m.110303 type:complete len:107 (+) Transcript_35296:72-392(+)
MNHLHFAMNPFVFGWHGEARGGGQGSSLHEGPPRPMHWPPPIDVPVDIFERVVSVPDSFICKITHDIMREPTMVCVSGHTYERAAIVTWHANSNGKSWTSKKSNSN